MKSKKPHPALKLELNHKIQRAIVGAISLEEIIEFVKIWFITHTVDHDVTIFAGERMKPESS